MNVSLQLHKSNLFYSIMPPPIVVLVVCRPIGSRHSLFYTRLIVTLVVQVPLELIAQNFQPLSHQLELFLALRFLLLAPLFVWV